MASDKQQNVEVVSRQILTAWPICDRYESNRRDLIQPTMARFQLVEQREFGAVSPAASYACVQSQAIGRQLTACTNANLNVAFLGFVASGAETHAIKKAGSFSDPA